MRFLGVSKLRNGTVTGRMRWISSVAAAGKNVQIHDELEVEAQSSRDEPCTKGEAERGLRDRRRTGGGVATGYRVAGSLRPRVCSKMAAVLSSKQHPANAKSMRECGMMLPSPDFLLRTSWMVAHP